MCCDSWGCKELDMTERLYSAELNDNFTVIHSYGQQDNRMGGDSGWLKGYPVKKWIWVYTLKK